MKSATIIFRILLGFIYLVFGLDYFLHFIPYQPMHTGNAETFKEGLKASGYFLSHDKIYSNIGWYIAID